MHRTKHRCWIPHNKVWVSNGGNNSQKQSLTKELRFKLCTVTCRKLGVSLVIYRVWCEWPLGTVGKNQGIGWVISKVWMDDLWRLGGWLLGDGSVYLQVCKGCIMRTGLKEKLDTGHRCPCNMEFKLANICVIFFMIYICIPAIFGLRK